MFVTASRQIINKTYFPPFSFMVYWRNGDSLILTPLHSLLSYARFTKYVAYANYVGHEIILLYFRVRRYSRNKGTQLQDDWNFEAPFACATSRMCYNGIAHNFAWLMLSQVAAIILLPLRFESVHSEITDGGFQKWWVKCYGRGQYEQRWTPRQILCLTVHFHLQLLPLLESHGVVNFGIVGRGSIPGRRSR